MKLMARWHLWWGNYHIGRLEAISAKQQAQIEKMICRRIALMSKCPKCGSERSAVLGKDRHGEQIRECRDCHHLWSEKVKS